MGGCGEEAWKVVYVRQCLITKKLKTFEYKNIETICTELPILKKKCFVLLAYRSPSFNEKSFFKEISSKLSIIVNQYENIFIADDLNVELLNLFRMEGGRKASPTGVTSTNIGISPKNFLIFSFNTFSTLI